MTGVDPSSVNVPRDEWEELLGVVRRSRKCPGVSHDQGCDSSDHDTWIANRACALVDAAERPPVPLFDQHATPRAPVGEPLCRCGHNKAAHEYEYLPKGHCSHGGTNGVPECRCARFVAPVPVSDEAEAAWQRISDDLPESFWNVATWDNAENWSPGSLDVADRKRIGLAIINALREDRP